METFQDRADAGRRLARELERFRGRDVVVLGLPRGGVPVAFEVARALGAPLDVLVVVKVGLPSRPELAVGAIGEGDVLVIDDEVRRGAAVSPHELRAVERAARAPLEALVALLRRGRPLPDLHGRVALVVDDGLATGSTARAACTVARRLGAARVVLAVPVAPEETVRTLSEADDVVCLSQPVPFLAVGCHYDDFSPTSDGEVVRLLEAAAVPPEPRPGVDEPGPGRIDTGVIDTGVIDTGVIDTEVEIPVGPHVLGAHLCMPRGAAGVVVFAHGSGSSRHSPRNEYVAEVLQRAGRGTLLLDLLTPAEAADRHNVFDIDLLAGRLAVATGWLRSRPGTAACRVGYFGASTGAAAALVAAAQPGARIDALVSRGGRPDLAGPWLPEVQVPTLLVVGGADEPTLSLNRQAQRQLRCPHRLEVVEGATHLFEEPGTLEAAAGLATEWFTQHCVRPIASPAAG